MKLLIATRNRHKLREIREILSFDGLILVGADELPGLPEVEESGATFAENAVKKATELCDASGLWTLADDSGLEVDALGGAPGVYSARYAGEQGNDGANNARLLNELQGVTERCARFRCVMALCSPDGRSWMVDGACEGRILAEARGGEGFGYDPLFVPTGFDSTFAELSADQKNQISHRGRALLTAQREWSDILSVS